jgi:hypothetical protein
MIDELTPEETRTWIIECYQRIFASNHEELERRRLRIAQLEQENNHLKLLLSPPCEPDRPAARSAVFGMVSEINRP